MNKNLNTQIEKLRKKRFNYSFCCGGDYCFGEHNEEVLKDIIEHEFQIKQSILKAIMEKKPKLKEFLKKGVSRDFDIGTYKFNQGIREFESVIKDLLEPKK